MKTQNHNTLTLDVQDIISRFLAKKTHHSDKVKHIQITSSADENSFTVVIRMDSKDSAGLIHSSLLRNAGAYIQDLKRSLEERDIIKFVVSQYSLDKIKFILDGEVKNEPENYSQSKKNATETVSRIGGFKQINLQNFLGDMTIPDSVKNAMRKLDGILEDEGVTPEIRLLRADAAGRDTWKIKLMFFEKGANGRSVETALKGHYVTEWMGETLDVTMPIRLVTETVDQSAENENVLAQTLIEDELIIVKKDSTSDSEEFSSVSPPSSLEKIRMIAHEVRAAHGLKTCGGSSKGPCLLLQIQKNWLYVLFRNFSEAEVRKTMPLFIEDLQKKGLTCFNITEKSFSVSSDALQDVQVSKQEHQEIPEKTEKKQEIGTEPKGSNEVTLSITDEMILDFLKRRMDLPDSEEFKDQCCLLLDVQKTKELSKDYLLEGFHSLGYVVLVDEQVIVLQKK